MSRHISVSEPITEVGGPTYHSTKTALVKVLNYIRLSTNWENNCTGLTRLAAFDTVDHAILFHRPEHLVGGAQ